MTAMDRVWLRHPETKGHFECPAAAVDDWIAMGWERSDPPEEPNPVIAEHLAWREQQNQTEAFIPKADKPARRGNTTGEMSNG